MELHEMEMNDGGEKDGIKAVPRTAQSMKTSMLDLTYGIDDVPPWYLCIFMALQHYLTMIGAIVSIPFILTPALCMAEDDPSKSHIISTMIFITGIVTFIQTSIGCRLPLVQGGTISFLVPTLAILNLPQWKCPNHEVLAAMDHENRTELWQARMRELSGAIAVSALFQVIIGFGGIIGWMLKFITPLTIVPTVSLVGLSLFENAANAASQHWGIAAGTVVMLTLFSQILVNVKVPIITYRKGDGLRIVWFALFRLFPVLLTIVMMWIVCATLTVTDALPRGHPGRTDSKLQILTDSAWFRVPYPGQWGTPTISLSSILGMLAGVLACTVESVSYYPTTSRMCGAPPPPIHAINRGIGVEGLGTVLAGLWGSGNGTNTFGENVGTIGLSALQYIDLNSSRNLYILGFSIFFPLVLSKWLSLQQDIIHTGHPSIDGVVTVLLSTTILVGGFTGCLLDHIIPGTVEERGLQAWAYEIASNTQFQADTTVVHEDEDAISEYNTFDFPVGMAFVRKWRWMTYLPFSPTYRPNQKLRKKEENQLSRTNPMELFSVP
ncbi:solute carrier family 23 member 2 isoform X4 [Venturia canescens]|uniref:solute carrier family 23 member 2 isoform X4 n=1 Tax=Venturia canescens TaxID=32260 RepID=UPI001C9CEBE1|nr:solute carrier family 23 member 2 isoform X4 [Venturia canescens]